jgi:hypothetical protein
MKIITAAKAALSELRQFVLHFDAATQPDRSSGK